MLRSQQWQQWLQGLKRFLWVHGIPGAGKTVLASYLIQQVKIACRSQGRHMVYYYCYFANNQDESLHLLRWILAQLCRKSTRIPEEVMYLYRMRHEPSLANMLQALSSILGDFDTVYVMIDAIDESLPRENTLKVLRDLATDDRFGKIRLFATSRQYVDIENAFSDISVSVSMSNPLVMEDIRLYVRSELRSRRGFSGWPQDLLVETENALSEGAKGM